MADLTEAQKRDLLKCHAVWFRTHGTYDYPSGNAIALRTGKSLAKLGLVELGNRYSANRRARWLPTAAGKTKAEELRLEANMNPPARFEL